MVQHPRKAAVGPGFWNQPLGYAHAALVVFAALAIGCFFHATIGYRLRPSAGSVTLWSIVSVAIIAVAVRRWRDHRVVVWFCGAPFAVASTAMVAALAAVGGYFPSAFFKDLLDLPSLFGSWPFISCAALLQLNLVGSSARRAWPLTRSNVAYLLTHGGLSLALIGGAIGAVTLERVRAVCEYGVPTDVALTEAGKPVQLPFALTLRDFKIDYFPPTLAVLTPQKTMHGSRPLAAGMAETVGGYGIEVLEYLPQAAFTGERYVRYLQPTAAPAARIRVLDASKRELAHGWISCGAIESPPAVLDVNDSLAIAMAELRPKKFHSKLQVDEGAQIELEVNKPAHIEGARVYQLDYDVKAGAASQYVVVEIVFDRSVPIVYTGLAALVLGVFLTFWVGFGTAVRGLQ